MKMNIQKSFSSRTGSKTLYLMTLFTLVALTAVGFFVLPNNTGTASASSVKSDGRATAEMLRVALDLRTATEYSVFAEQGIKEDGRSSVKGGNSGVASRDAEMGARVRNDLAASFNAINQLPATEISQLRSGSYSAGVYAAKSADLAGEFVLDAAGDQNAIFVFRVDGAITAKSGLNFSLVNGANAGNVFFVSNERASVEAGVDFAGNILAKGSINVEAGAKVNGRTLSLGGEVKLTEAAVGGGTGILEICKEAAGAGLENRVFAFRIGGIVREAPVGGCTGPIDLPAGPVTIEELLEGRTLPAGTFTNRFRLLSVTSSVAGSLGTVNLPLRTAVVNVREGSIANQTVVTFTNTFAIMAVIEICKRPALAIGSTTADSLDVTGFFSFTVDAIQNTTFSVPVGACSGPIQVTVPTFAGPFPAPGDVTVTELGRPGFTLESGSTFPADRFNEIVLGSGVNNTDPRCIDERRDANGVVIPAYALPTTCFFPNAGGGYISGDVLEGGTASQTTFNFFNRANPAVLKICKIAGPGIPEGTPFTYEVRGTAPTSATVIAPGVQVTRDVTVLAGPAAQGGFCEFVETAPGSGVNQTFIVGTNIAVVETDFLGTIPGVGPGQVRTANIRSSTGFSGAASVTAPPATACVPGGQVSLTGSATSGAGNPDLEYVVAGQTTCNDAAFISSAAIVPSRAATVEVEFTNFVFNPTLLKICKIAGNGTAVGTPFTFNVAISNPASFGLNGALYAPALTTVSPVTVQAGPASQGGYCTFAQGPFTPTVSTPPVGTFNVGSTVTITEPGATGVTVTSVTSPTGTVVGPVSGTIGAGGSGALVLGFRNGFNEIAFVNTTATTPPPTAPRAAFDFDGDGKSDATVFRPSTGDWWYAASSAGGQQRANKFGVAGDKLVAADYDGDGIADRAVVRNTDGYAIWHISESSTGKYRAEQFGLATDIPQTGDFDGDGKADLAVFRGNNDGNGTGVWYMMNSRDGFGAVQFGSNGDRPVAADFDGDGRTDAAIYRNGTWHMLGSRDGYTAVQFGLAADKPVAADYDGDGRADAAVYRDGIWHLLRSKDGYTSVQFGLAADKPVPADYNGDGKTDLAVYRDGAWHVLSSGQGEAGTSYSNFNFGNGTDQPAAAN